MSGEGKRTGVTVSVEDVTGLVISKSAQRRKEIKDLASNFHRFLLQSAEADPAATDVKFSEICNVDFHVFEWTSKM